jgi:AcrR family transcriptional regulator
MTTAPIRVPGLRERKKEATRQALHEAAVRLAVANGLEGLTVEAISDDVGVSRRTFSNYFGGKEEALLYSDQRRLARLLALVDGRPPAEEPWAALAHAARDLALDGVDDPRWLAQLQMLRNTPALLAERVAIYGTAERALAERVAVRLPRGVDGPDVTLAARLLAATFLAAVRIATQYWVDHPDTSLAAVLDDALTLARS